MKKYQDPYNVQLADIANEIGENPELDKLVKAMGI